jgi:hypothetical protein
VHGLSTCERRIGSPRSYRDLMLALLAARPGSGLIVILLIVVAVVLVLRRRRPPGPPRRP